MLSEGEFVILNAAVTIPPITGVFCRRCSANFECCIRTARLTFRSLYPVFLVEVTTIPRHTIHQQLC